MTLITKHDLTKHALFAELRIAVEWEMKEFSDWFLALEASNRGTVRRFLADYTIKAKDHKNGGSLAYAIMNDKYGGNLDKWCK